ncbi:hypothetical protein CONPUDRAFT_160305 [Coniophora puteana RWD-64-598 SS2]|uniref:F-box domain-containing protein n=1 Tax=Coniophora puteana (strain RWD-64-598) TaxID=741705 RepID=R7SDM7_CONPW|nr:uncharacterized protein CONPUDRAFT_160305 [Coniophora puteana RWD-64-598 SS2]EIW74261.1 hypothetical protein CONPUDRAFT_160305 [Coniophora puteana RWD-64-598 SS2]
MTLFSKIVKTSTDAIKFFQLLARYTPNSNSVVQPGQVSDQPVTTRKRRISFSGDNQTPKRVKFEQELGHTSRHDNNPRKSPSQRSKLTRTSPPKRQKNQFPFSNQVIQWATEHQAPDEGNDAQKRTHNWIVQQHLQRALSLDSLASTVDQAGHRQPAQTYSGDNKPNSKRAYPFDEAVPPPRKRSRQSAITRSASSSLVRLLRRQGAYAVIPTRSRRLGTLPPEILLCIFDSLDWKSRMAGSQACRVFASVVARLIGSRNDLRRTNIIPILIFNIDILVHAARLQSNSIEPYIFRPDVFLSCSFPAQSDIAFFVRGLVLLSEFVPAGTPLKFSLFLTDIPVDLRKDVATLVCNVHQKEFGSIAIFGSSLIDPPARLQRGGHSNRFGASSYREVTLSSIAFQDGMAGTTRHILASGSSIRSLSLACVRLKPHQWGTLLNPLTIPELEDFAVPVTCPGSVVQDFLGRHQSITYLTVEEYHDDTQTPAGFRVPEAVSTLCAPLAVWQSILRVCTLNSLYHASINLPAVQALEAGYLADVHAIVSQCVGLGWLTITLPQGLAREAALRVTQGLTFPGITTLYLDCTRTTGVDTGDGMVPLVGAWTSSFPDLTTFRFRPHIGDEGFERGFDNIRGELRAEMQMYVEDSVDLVIVCF